MPLRKRKLLRKRQSRSPQKPKGRKSTRLAPNSAGGAASAGGDQFQGLVAAWWLGNTMLQSRQLAPSFDFPANSYPTRVSCQTGDKVDDVRVDWSGGEQLYIQCKKSLSLSSAKNSEFYAVIKSFGEQLQRASGKRISLVVCYQRHNGNLSELNDLLNRYRSLPKNALLNSAAVNAIQREVARIVQKVLRSLSHDSTLRMNAAQRHQLLRSCFVHQLSLDALGADRIAMTHSLQASVITDSQPPAVAINSLIVLGEGLHVNRSSLDNHGARNALKNVGVLLKESPELRGDFTVIKQITDQNILLHKKQGRCSLSNNGRTIEIPRQAAKLMATSAGIASFLVVGGAGAGKTGCILSLVERLQKSGKAVLYWAADSAQKDSIVELQAAFGLAHKWHEIFADAAAGAGLTLVIDGLDGIRNHIGSCS